MQIHIPIKNEPITEIDIHLFSNANIDGVCTVACAEDYPSNKVSQRLITCKSRLAKKNTSTPRLELIAAHMFSNLEGNLKCILRKFNIREVYAWCNSTVTLNLLKNNKEYKVLNSNQVAKIKKCFIKADLSSRGCDKGKAGQNWWECPLWLRDPKSWPGSTINEISEESKIERKRVRNFSCESYI